MTRKRREFSRTVKSEILHRCKTPTGFRCEGCGAIVTSGEIDHIIAEELVIDKSQKLTAADGQFLCDDCHRRIKTPADQGIIAKAKRQEAAHLGITRPKPKIKSPGFAPTSTKRKVHPVAMPERRPMFEDVK